MVLQKIGWRPRETSRRLVVFVSDETFHIAGDGKVSIFSRLYTAEYDYAMYSMEKIN